MCFCEVVEEKVMTRFRLEASMGSHSLSNPQRRLLRAMQESDAQTTWSVASILEACGWSDQAQAAGAALGLVEAGFADVDEKSTIKWTLGPEGKAALENGLLEARLWTWLSNAKEEESYMRDLQSSGIVEKHETGIGVGLLKGLGVEIESGCLIIPTDSMAEEIIQERYDFLSNIVEGPLLDYFKGRKGLLQSSESTSRTWMITEAGSNAESLDEVDEVVELTPEMLQGEEWREMTFKSFDQTLESTTPTTGKPHPMQSLIERVRSVFLEMGFSEIDGDYVQSAGWNMDALFIPQDHPAREMQDTFYLDEPASLEIDENNLKQWKDIHQHGGETGSTGWGGKFSDEIARKGLLRTHTTVNTIKHLADAPDEPCRVFAVGRVFRKESIDRTHLPEFHQIEGIIMEPGANLPMLVTTLKTFYAKMGYPEVRVRPAYFPYTEPSLEVEVKWRGKWLELGGAGIFRPEVSEPLGVKWPVCAWGMGLERLAMLVLGLDDIRQLYISDLEWLQNQPVL